MVLDFDIMINGLKNMTVIVLFSWLIIDFPIMVLSCSFIALFLRTGPQSYLDRFGIPRNQKGTVLLIVFHFKISENCVGCQIFLEID